MGPTKQMSEEEVVCDSAALRLHSHPRVVVVVVIPSDFPAQLEPTMRRRLGRRLSLDLLCLVSPLSHRLLALTVVVVVGTLLKLD